VPFQIDFGQQKKPRVVGIDLGTTNSLVAFMDLTAPRSSLVKTATNSFRAWSRSRRRATSSWATKRGGLITDPERTVYSVKRLMGRGIEDVREELSLFPFRIAEGSESVIKLQLGEVQFTPPEISAFVLRQLKKNAEDYFGEPVTQAVITVPGVLQRRSTAGHQGCRAHRRFGGPAAGERADGGVARLRTRQAERRHDRRLRSGRRHLRHFDSQTARRHLRSAGHARRYAPGRRRYR
jgi:hypothetical protein